MAENLQVFVLPEKLTVEEVEEVKDAMINFLNENGPKIRCDGSLVSTIDTSGLQLLLVFNNSAAKGEKKFVVFNPSTELQDAFRDSGVDKVLTTEVLN